MSQQIPLDFPYQEPATQDEFLRTACNADALEWIQKPFHILLITGDKGSGKTHLAHLFSTHVISAKDLNEDMLPTLPNKLALDDIDKGVDETVLFHLFNTTKENGQSVLMTAEKMPAWNLSDLKTRMNTVPVAAILPPDDLLMMSLLCKNFTTRQVDVDSDVVNYLMTHMPRSYAAIHAITEAADKLSLSQKRRITINLIKDVLESIRLSLL